MQLSERTAQFGLRRDVVHWLTLTLFATALSISQPLRAQSVPVKPKTDKEDLIFTAPGFNAPGQPAIAKGEQTATLKINIRDAKTGKPTFCRVNVVGPDGNYYEPKQNYLTKYSLTGEWPNWPKAWGNRPGKAPFRYFGRFFYTWGEPVVVVPAGTVRIDVWKGFEYRPVTYQATVEAGQTHEIELKLEQPLSLPKAGYYSGDPHIHITRQSDKDDQTILDLMEAEDIHFGAILGYNEPAGPYAGFMKQMDTPQFRGLGKKSIRSRDTYHVISGQEYRTATYGHLNLFLRDELVFKGKSFNADDWPLYGNVGLETQKNGGFAFYAHGGYAQAIYADLVQGAVNGVELLQFGVYRGMGLADWYHTLNIGYRFPCTGASDYPACRKLGDCKTFVYLPEQVSFREWMKEAAAGRSFVSTGPLLLLEVDGNRPGSQIKAKKEGPRAFNVQVKVRSEVAPVTHVQIVINGKVAEEFEIPAARQTGHTIELDQRVELNESSWIAARAFSKSPQGAADAEAHTNPVYVYFGDKAPYNRDSLDAIVGEIDKQIAARNRRDFKEKAHVVAYFQRSRDMLMKIRAVGGLTSEHDPQQLARAVSDAELIEDVFEMTDAQLKEFLKPVPPQPPEQAVKTFETIDGFEMQLVASEPQVFDPIAAAFDENGNLFVCEMRDYPYKPQAGDEPIGTVRLLRDQNGDGQFDKSTVFADKLLWAGGVAPWKGGVFVAAPPDIWYMKDTDGDDVADIRRKVFTGFGTGNQQAMLNNLKFWLDHKIYGSTAGNGGTIETVGNPEAKSVSVNRRDFRFDPVSEQFESITGTIQFGSTFDDWGNRFLCSESQPLHHPVLPQRYLERNPFLPVPYALKNIAPGPVPIFRISPVERWRQLRSLRRVASGSRPADSAGASHHVIDAAAGVTVYRGGAYPKSYYGNVFIGDGQNNLVHRRRLAPDGVTFSSHRIDDRTEVVRSSDIWFRPVNFVNAPDGTLYVLDMSREVLEAIHIPLDIVRHLDLASGRGYGRIYRLAPPNFKPAPPPQLGKTSTSDLVKALESPHGWWRDTAHRLIYERQDLSAVGPLRQLVAESSLPQAKVHALWSLYGLKRLADDDLLNGLKAESPRVREHAVRLSEDRLDNSPQVLNRVLTLADDPDARLRLQVAFSLGETRDTRATKVLAEMLQTADRDRWIHSAVLSSIGGNPGELFHELLNDAGGLQGDNVTLLEQLASLAGVRNRPMESHRILQTVATHPKLARKVEIKRKLIASLGRGLKRVGKPLAADSQLSSAAEPLLKELFESAIETAADAKAAEATRHTAIQLASLFPFEESRAMLTRLLDTQQPQSIQLAAVAALSDYPAPQVANILLGHWQESVPAVRIELIRALLSREERTVSFLKAAAAGRVAVTQVDPARRDLLLTHRNPDIRRLAESQFGKLVSSARQSVIDKYRASLDMPGDVARGREVFVRDCSSCHQLEGKGHKIGPNLASSPSRDPEAILTHVLDPNRYVLPNYVQYVVVDTNGRTYTGMIVSETATSITLTREKAATDTILRAQIEELVSSGKSLMPEGLEKKITKQDMAHLLAYLQSSRNQAGKQPRTAKETRKERDFGTLPGLIEPAKKD